MRLDAAGQSGVLDLLSPWATGRIERAVIGAGDRPPAVDSAIYVVEDTAGRIDYVGKVHRPGDQAAMVDRLRSHFRDYTRRSTWMVLYVFELKPALDLDHVYDLEGRAIRALLPGSNKVVPRRRAPIGE